MLLWLGAAESPTSLTRCRYYPVARTPPVVIKIIYLSAWLDLNKMPAKLRDTFNMKNL